MKSKLNYQEERSALLSYLCGVSGDYIKKQWNISPITVRGSVFKRSYSWDDQLIEFYRETDSRNRVKNAIHLYLVFNTRLRKLKRKDHSYVKEELFIRERDEPVYVAVDEDIFSPRTRDLIKKNNLEKILGSVLPSDKELSREERLLRVIFEPTDYTRASYAIDTFIFECLKVAYHQDGKIQLNKVYRDIEETILKQIRFGLILAKDKRIREYKESLEQKYLRSLQRSIGKPLSKQVEELLEELSPRKEKILRMRYGMKGFEEIGDEFKLSRERIQRIKKGSGLKRFRRKKQK